MGHFWAIFGPPLWPKVFQRLPYGLGPPGTLFERGIGHKKELVYNLFSSYGFLFASKIHFLPRFCSFLAPLWPKVLRRSPYGLTSLVLCFDRGTSQKMDLICEFFRNFSLQRFFWANFQPFWPPPVAHSCPMVPIWTLTPSCII